MRRALCIAVVLGLWGVVHVSAKENDGVRAPSEEAVTAATRNLLRVPANLGEPDSLDVLARYVDVPEIARRVFGVRAVASLAAESDSLMRDLARFLVVSLIDRAPRPDNPAETELVSSELSTGSRRVTYTVGSRRVHLDWATSSNTGRPMLVDTGTGAHGMMTTFLKRQWAESAKSPGRYMKGLLAGQRVAADQARSIDNIRKILTALNKPNTGGYPPYSGKAFIVALVADGRLDVRGEAHLEILFSPADRHRSLASVGRSRYDAIASGEFSRVDDFSDLTSYAGRRNAEAAYRLASEDGSGSEPLVADLHFRDVAIVGFANGSVRVMTRSQLGLGDGDSIAAVADSNSGILRALSNK